MQSRSTQFLLLNVANLVIATSGPIGRQIQLSADYNIFLRCVLASLFLFILTRIQKESIQLSKSSTTKVFLSGILLCGHWVFYFISLKISSVAIGVISMFSFPIMTTLLEPLFLRTRFHWITLLNSLLVIVGIWFLVPEFDMSNNSTQGVFWGLLSALCYALRNLINKSLIGSLGSTTIMFYQVSISALALSYTLFTTPVIVPSKNDQLLLIVLALFTTSIGHTLFVKSLRYFSTSSASIISSLQPIYGIIIAAIFMGEIPEKGVYIGGAIIIITVVIQSIAEISFKKQK